MYNVHIAYSILCATYSNDFLLLFFIFALRSKVKRIQSFFLSLCAWTVAHIASFTSPEQHYRKTMWTTEVCLYHLICIGKRQAVRFFLHSLFQSNTLNGFICTISKTHILHHIVILKHINIWAWYRYIFKWYLPAIYH